MTDNDYLQSTQEMLMHGLILATILVFWAAVSHLVGLGMESANLSRNLASTVAGALGQTGLVNAVLYVLLVAARTYRE
jgi:hypothetical protein